MSLNSVAVTKESEALESALGLTARTSILRGTSPVLMGEVDVHLSLLQFQFHSTLPDSNPAASRNFS